MRVRAGPADLQRLGACPLRSGAFASLRPDGLTRVAVTFAPSAMVAPRVMPVAKDSVR